MTVTVSTGTLTMTCQRGSSNSPTPESLDVVSTITRISDAQKPKMRKGKTRFGQD